MITAKKDINEITLRILVIGLFLFVFTALNNNRAHNHYDDEVFVSVSETSEYRDNGILSTPTQLPSFDSKWVYTDNSFWEFTSNRYFSSLISKLKDKTKYRLYSNISLNIKPLRFNIAADYMYSLYDQGEFPFFA